MFEIIKEFLKDFSQILHHFWGNISGIFMAIPCRLTDFVKIIKIFEAFAKVSELSGMICSFAENAANMNGT